MPEPLKNMYNLAFFEQFCKTVKEEYPAFDEDSFLKLIFDSEWESKKLMQRKRHITHCLHEVLNMEFVKVVEILSAIVDRCRGFQYLFFPDYIEVYGQQDLPTSIEALALFTPSSSSEFAVRPFILNHPDLMMVQMLEWAKHPNHHVRRLASEGCRPRLPWGIGLKIFQEDPAPIFPILEHLKQDESEYVRKSVANNLNDITKDHPEMVIALAKTWHGKHPHTDAILKHALRSQLKKGSLEALALFGFTNPDAFSINQFSISHRAVAIGEAIEFSFVLSSQSNVSSKLRLEYAVDYMKARGKHSTKVFQISESRINGGEKAIVRKHSFRDLSTRKHYPGVHRITLIVNGKAMADAEFELKQN